MEAARVLARQAGRKSVCLSGGVFQNRVLLELATAGLQKAGLAVYLNRQVPANDSGLQLGQAWHALKGYMEKAG